MPKGYHHLAYDQRCQIYALKSTGLSQNAIARQIGVHPSTISRELSRNSGKKGYRHKQAQTQADIRQKEARGQSRVMTPDVIQLIENALKQSWSPEQISGRFKLEKNVKVSHETIYQYIYQNRRTGGTLYQYLRHKGKKYNKRSKGMAGRGLIPNRVDLSERPTIVETKSRIGDWEGDLIIGANHQGALLTLVDRKTKYTIIEKLPDKQALGVALAITDRLSLIQRFVKTITFDNGKEFSSHQQLSKTLKADIYFATPYHSWERGLNEHTNGLIRQYFPKSTNFQKISDEQIKFVESALNKRPRKVLNYRTPREEFMRSLKPNERIALAG